MAESRPINGNIRAALSNLAQEARNLLENFEDRNSANIERRLMQSCPSTRTTSQSDGQGTRETNVMPVSSSESDITQHFLRSPTENRPDRSPSLNSNNMGASHSNMSRGHRRSEDVPAALRRSFPTLASKSSFSKSVKKAPAKKAKKSNIIYKDLILLPTATTSTVPTHQTRCQLENNGFVIHGCPIDKSWDDLELKNQIKGWFPMLEENVIDVDFVKSCYGQIVTPKLATGVKFTAARVLSLSGQGSIYIRPKEDIPNDDDVGSYSPESGAAFSDNSDIQQNSNLQDNASISQGQDEPCSSRNLQKDINKLQEMFPDTTVNILEHALEIHGTLDKAALSLSNLGRPLGPFTDDEDDELLQPATFLPEDTNLNTVLKGLEAQLSNEKEKIKVEEEDLFNDAMCYYKDPNFDPRKRLRVVYQGQPAVDTGGVMRQFFTNLLNIISDMFFEGCPYKSPIYNANVVASGMMRYIGTIIIHSILQGGPGFPVFSPSIYQYLSTGNFELAMKTANIGECSVHMRHFIDQVDNTDDVKNLDEDECLNILSECGLTETLTNENKIKIIQLLIIHDVIGRRKIVLDQIAEGFNTLGFRDKMKEYPQMFAPLFVPSSESEMSQSAVVDVLEFPEVLSEDESQIANNLQRFLLNADSSCLEKFLIFTTGSTRLPNYGLGKIKVKFNNASSFFASTCLFSITLPNQLTDQQDFIASMEAVLESSKKSFTSP